MIAVRHKKQQALLWSREWACNAPLKSQDIADKTVDAILKSSAFRSKMIAAISNSRQTIVFKLKGK